MTPFVAHLESPGQADESTVIAIDARLDNREELAAAQGAAKGPSWGVSDAELIGRAYAAWGEGCAERLLGDFAFLVWDRRRRRVFMARDPFGMRPLFYWFDGRVLVAGSEPRQLFEHPSVPRRANWALVADYLCGNRTNSGETLYDGIKSVRAGHSVTIDLGGIVERRHWRPEELEPIHVARTNDCPGVFRDLLREAVRRRVSGERAVGVLLSGGLDSSSVACLSWELYRSRAGTPFETISIKYPGLPCDETAYVELVRRGIDMPAHDVVYGPAFVEAARLDQAAQYPDIPFECAYFGQVLTTSGVARERTLRVVLTGVGGDEVLAPAPTRLADSLGHLNLRRAVRQIRGLSGDHGLPPWAALMRFGLRPLLPPWGRRLARTLRGRGDADARGRPWVNRDFMARHWSPDRTAAPEVRGRRPFARRYLQWLLTASHSAAYALPSFGRFYRRRGIDIRHPFFDRQLAEYCLRLPDEYRAPEGRSKQLLRAALRGVLPEAIRQRRSKPYFNSVTADLMRRHGVAVATVLRDLKLAEAGVIEPRPVELLLQAGIGADPFSPLVEILELELWYRGLLALPPTQRPL